MTTMTTATRTDSGLLSPAWAATGVEALVSDQAWVQAMLDVEVALAQTQAELGVIPARAAEAIALAANADRLDLDELVVGVRATANPVVGLVKQLTSVVEEIDPAAVEFVHRGSTSQDILDSAAMLRSAQVLSHVLADLWRTAHALARHAEEHRTTPMVGRTLTQHAVPITFGLKAGGWLQLVLDAVERTRRVATTGLPASLGGAAGTLSAYAEYAAIAETPGDDGIELIAPFAARLGLAEPVVPWHSLRSPLADLGAALTFVVGALGKFATDVQVMTRTEIREVVEPAAPGRGASSAMPQKHNPVFATLVATAARQLPAHALVLSQCMVTEDERSAGAWHAEWQPLRECLRLAAGAASNAAELAEGLVVQPDRMRENLGLTGGAVVSERVNAVLAPRLGKVTAKQLLTEATGAAERSGADVAEVLADRLDEQGQHIDRDELRALLDPERYTGASAKLVDRALGRYRALRADRP